MSKDKQDNPRIYEAHAQPYVRIRSLTIQENPIAGMPPPAVIHLRPLPPAVFVPIPPGGTTTLTVKAGYRMPLTTKLIAMLTDQDSLAKADIGPINGAACGPDWCFDFILDTRGKHYDLDVQIVDIANPTNVHVSEPGPQIDT
jgi:hypothetical protein